MLINKLAKVKKPNLPKSKKSKLAKAKKLDFATTQTFGINVFIPKNKKIFIHLPKVFIKVLILEHFDPKHHVYIETLTSEYAISRILSQIFGSIFFGSCNQ